MIARLNFIKLEKRRKFVAEFTLDIADVKGLIRTATYVHLVP